MSASVIISICAASVLPIIIMVKVTQVIWRRSQYKNWEVGDLVALKNYSDLRKLQGWSDEALYIEDKNGTTTKVGWDKYNFNKSAVWRANYDECKKAMGKDPDFTRGLTSNNTIGKKVDGKPIELLSEVECEVYLKQSLANEDYETAELIRKRMEKFR